MSWIGRIGDDPAAADDDQVVRRQRHLAHQVRGHEDRAALGGERLEQVADPEHALRVQAVDRLVQHDGLRVAEQRGGDAQPLAHAEGEAADPLLGHALQAGQLDDLVHPAVRDAVGGGQRHQVVVRGPAGVNRLGLQQRADLVQRRGCWA